MNLVESKKVPDKKIYCGIDMMKLVCAVLIVYMHTYCWDTGSIGLWIRNELTCVAVPFFFISSGYFYGVGIRRAEDKKSYFQSYFIRIFKMYVIWTVFSLPAAWYNVSTAHGEYSVILKVFYLIRGFFFTGSIGVYWYLLALLVNSIIFYLMYTKKLEKIVYPLAVLFFGIGVLYAASMLSDTALGKMIYYVFSTERNFLNVGLFYMAIGYFLSDKVINVKADAAAACSLLLLVIETIADTILPVKFVHAFVAVALFIFAHQIELKPLEKISRRIRKLSTAIYLEHFPFILLFDFYLYRGTLIDFSVTMLFVIGLYLLVSRILPEKWITVIYGN